VALRITLQTKLVLTELLGGRPRHGLDICDRTALPGGTVYPILARLEQVGWAESRWEEPEVHEAERRPRRRYYWLTADGAKQATDALAATYRGGKRVGPPRPSLPGAPA
jgi:PadR family transcriptional regulator, regulatory protein PadR